MNEIEKTNEEVKIPVIPKELRHMFFSSLEIQMDTLTKQDKKLSKAGKPISVTFLLSKEINEQKYIFENYVGKTKFSDEERNKFCIMLNMNIKKELENYKSYFVKLDFKSRKIFIQKVRHNGVKTELLAI